MPSRGAFHRADAASVLAGERALVPFLGGVFHMLRYDNLTLAVKKILRGRQREETKRVIAFRSHWGFRSEYCNPAVALQSKPGLQGLILKDFRVYNEMPWYSLAGLLYLNRFWCIFGAIIY
jgi:hypothetical protein